MALNRDKHNIEVRDDDAIKRNWILYDFVQQTFSYLDGLYMDGKCPLIDRIKNNQLRKQSAWEFERLNRDKKGKKQKKEGTSKPSPKKMLFYE